MAERLGTSNGGVTELCASILDQVFIPACASEAVNPHCVEKTCAHPSPSITVLKVITNRGTVWLRAPKEPQNATRPRHSENHVSLVPVRQSEEEGDGAISSWAESGNCKRSFHQQQTI